MTGARPLAALLALAPLPAAAEEVPFNGGWRLQRIERGACDGAEGGPIGALSADWRGRLRSRR